jgi:DNA-directed RNA polymerase specialized sigma24 family protein
MSVEFRGSTSRPAEDPLTADASPVAGQHAYVAFAAALFDYCARLLGDQVEAACAVQDSLVAVNAQFSNMPKPEQLRVPLYAAARRQCLSRRPGRRPRLTGRSGKTAAGHAGVASPDDGVPTSDGTAPRTVGETLPAVTAAVARLPDRDREVLNLAFRHGINGADLAAVLGLSSRRTRSLLSGASDRFGKSAAVEVVLRSGGAGAVGRDAGCPVLAGIVSQQDAVPAPLAAKLIRLNRHVESCSDCACTLGDRTFSPGLISQVPLTVPADRLRLRMIRTALALGSYRRQVTSLRNDVDSGRPPLPFRRRPGAPGAMAVASAALAFLAVPGVLLYQHESRSAPRPVPARVVSGVQSPSPVSPELSPPPPGPHPSSPPLLPTLPGAGPAPLGVLPVPPRGGSSPSPVPVSQSASPTPRSSPSQSPSSQPSPTPTTPSSTPPPTPTPTPDPTPTSTPTPTPDPTPTSTPPPTPSPSPTTSG